jgi:hypothetical protein
MKDFIEKVINTYVKDKMQSGIYTILVLFISSIWSLSYKVPSFLIPTTHKQIDLLCKAAISILLIAMALALSLISHLKKVKVTDCEIINPPGFLRHKKSGAYYCQKCLVENKRATELSTVSTHQFRCRVCNETYDIDYSVLICTPYLSMLHDKAANELIIKKEETV